MVARKVTWLALGAMAMMVGAARANHIYDCSPIVELASNIDHDAHDLQTEFDAAYRSSPYYGQLVAHARVICARADRLETLARVGADQHAMHRLIDDIGRSYSALAQALRAADSSHWSGHSGHYRQPGHTHREHVRQHMASLNRSIELAHRRLTTIFNPTRPGHHGGHHHHASGPEGFAYGTPANTPTAGFSFGNGRISFSFGR